MVPRQRVIMLRAVPESTGPGVRVGRVQSSGRCGFSEQVAAPTRLSCPGFSRGKRVDARCDGEQSGRSRRLRV